MPDAKKLGKKQDTDRPIFIKFTHFSHKEKLPFDTTNIPEGIPRFKIILRKNCECREIELMQDMMLPFFPDAY